MYEPNRECQFILKDWHFFKPGTNRAKEWDSDTRIYIVTPVVLSIEQTKDVIKMLPPGSSVFYGSGNLKVCNTNPKWYLPLTVEEANERTGLNLQELIASCV